MASGSLRLTQARDAVVQSRIHRDRDHFVKSISEDDVRRVASQHHHGDGCRFFKSPVRGSFNICFFVQFDSGDAQSEADKCVVRVPLSPCLPRGGRNKLESEVATMRLIADKTTIPIPTVRAYSLDGFGSLPSYVILDFVEGERFSHTRYKELSDPERECFLESLADIQLQLRRLELPAIGRLTQGPDGVEVTQHTNSIDINLQEQEGLQTSKLQDSYREGPLTSANDYVAMLLDISDNAFLESRAYIMDDGEGDVRELAEDSLFHHSLFREHATSWMDQSLDSGPFVLVHGDLEPFNLLVNGQAEIVSVLDWEWARVVPRQFFTPPLWLMHPDFTVLASKAFYQLFRDPLDEYLSIVRARERKAWGKEMLAEEWAIAERNSGFLVAFALETWTAMDWFASRYIAWERFRDDDLTARIAAFMAADGKRRDIIAKKVDQARVYKVELEALVPEGSRKSSKGSDGLFSRVNVKNIRLRFKQLPHLATSTFLLGGLTVVVWLSYFMQRRRAALQ